MTEFEEFKKLPLGDQLMLGFYLLSLVAALWLFKIILSTGDYGD